MYHVPRRIRLTQVAYRWLKWLLYIVTAFSTNLPRSTPKLIKYSFYLRNWTYVSLNFNASTHKSARYIGIFISSLDNIDFLKPVYRQTIMYFCFRSLWGSFTPPFFGWPRRSPRPSSIVGRAFEDDNLGRVFAGRRKTWSRRRTNDP